MSQIDGKSFAVFRLAMHVQSLWFNPEVHISEYWSAASKLEFLCGRAVLMGRIL